MKKKKKLILLILAVVALITVIGATFAYAAPVAEPAVPGETVTDKSEEYNLDSYQTYVVDKGFGWFRSFDFAQRINDGANMIFDFNKIIYEGFKSGLDLFGGSALINDHVATFTAFSKSIFDSLFANYGLTIVSCMGIYCFYLFFFKNPNIAIRQAISFALVLIFAFYWNANATNMVRGFDNISRELQAQVISAGDSSQNTNANNASIKIKNTLFDFAIEEPFLLMNYGVTDKDKINTPDNPEMAKELLYSESMTEEVDNEQKAKVEELAEDNVFLQKSKVGWKLAVSILSMPMTFAIGTPLLVIEFMNFVLQIISLAMVAIVGVILVLSMIPKFQSIVWNIMKKIIGIFGIRIALGLSMSLIIMMINIVRTFIPSKDVSSYLLQVVVIIALLVIIWKKKDTILSFVTGGMLQSADGGIGKRLSAPVKEKANKGKELGLDLASLGLTGMTMSALKSGQLLKNRVAQNYRDRHEPAEQAPESDEPLDGEIIDDDTQNQYKQSSRRNTPDPTVDGEFEEMPEEPVSDNLLQAPESDEPEGYDYTLDSLNVPELDSVDTSALDEIDIPELENIDVPEMDEIDMPEFDIPEFPEVDISDVEIDSVLNNPEFNQMSEPGPVQQDVITDFSQTVTTEEVFKTNHESEFEQESLGSVTEDKRVIEKEVEVLETFNQVGTGNVRNFTDYTNQEVNMDKVIDFNAELERLRG